MKKTLILATILIGLTSCASIRRYNQNYEIWFPGKVAQQKQLKGDYGNGCDIRPKSIFRRY